MLVLQVLGPLEVLAVFPVPFFSLLLRQLLERWQFGIGLSIGFHVRILHRVS